MGRMYIGRVRGGRGHWVGKRGVREGCKGGVWEAGEGSGGIGWREKRGLGGGIRGCEGWEMGEEKS